MVNVEAGLAFPSVTMKNQASRPAERQQTLPVHGSNKPVYRFTATPNNYIHAQLNQSKPKKSTLQVLL